MDMSFASALQNLLREFVVIFDTFGLTMLIEIRFPTDRAAC